MHNKKYNSLHHAIDKSVIKMEIFLTKDTYVHMSNLE